MLWVTSEIEKLRNLRALGYTIADCAVMMGRSYNSVKHMLYSKGQTYNQPSIQYRKLVFTHLMDAARNTWIKVDWMDGLYTNRETQCQVWRKVAKDNGIKIRLRKDPDAMQVIIL